MPLTGPQLHQIHQAILAAYTRDELRRVLKVGMDVDFDAVVPEKAFGEQVFALVEWADRQGMAAELVRCAWENNQRNATLTSLWSEVQQQGIEGIIPLTVSATTVPQLAAALERERYRTILANFLIPLEGYLAYTYKVFDDLRRDTDIVHLELNPEGLKHFYSMVLPKNDPRRITWMKTIERLQAENRKIVKLIEDNYGSIVLPEFRDACTEFKVHANAWEDFWAALKETGIDTPREIYEDLVSTPFPRSFPYALNKEYYEVQRRASGGE